jgi:hypothetical protein
MKENDTSQGNRSGGFPGGCLPWFIGFVLLLLLVSKL